VGIAGVRTEKRCTAERMLLAPPDGGAVGAICETISTVFGLLIWLRHLPNIKRFFAAVLFSWCLLLPSAWATETLPVLRSEAKVIDFEVSAYLKTKWVLQPELNPDVFVLPEYLAEQKVTFNTEVDSLSFVAKPGQTYDLVVLLNNRDRCRIAIVALAPPILLGGGMGVLVCVGFVVVGLVAFGKKRAVRARALLSFGVIAPASFWILTVAGGFIHGNYNHLTMVVSELGATGTRSELFMSLGELLVAVECLLFSAGLYRACEERSLSVIPALSTLAMPISMAWAAIFPMRHDWHGALGPMPLVLNVGALLAFLLWRGPEASRLRRVSLASFGMMGLILLRFVPALQSSYPGLVQRLYYAGWSFWSGSLGIIFMGILKCEGASGREAIERRITEERV
jgi:hypothetical protein